MSENPLTIKQLLEIQKAFAKIPEVEGANATSTQTSTPLSVRKPANKSAEFGPIRPTEPPKTQPSYPDTKQTTIKPNTKARGRTRAFKASTGKN